ncbi:MAG TPA: EAL domain-containing protein [Methyloceanibacter sp.]|nr:EAL domain-containing protein [Methyloceanibacter sp.]
MRGFMGKWGRSVSASSNEFAGGGYVPPGQPVGSVVDFESPGCDVQAPLDLEQVLESAWATAYRWDFTAAISDVKAAIKFVSTLKGLGCRVALDDFGAGYTSFRSLRELGVDMVKIDGSFIQNLGTDAEDEMFVRALIDLARNFGVVTVGEWVGDERTV